VADEASPRAHWERFAGLGEKHAFRLRTGTDFLGWVSTTPRGRRRARDRRLRLTEPDPCPRPRLRLPPAGSNTRRKP
jgi:hypothetical protein